MSQMSAAGTASAGTKGRVFTARVVGSIVIFSIVSAVCVVWLATLVIIPMVTTVIEFTATSIASLGFDILITVLIVLALVHDALDLVTTAALRVKRVRHDESKDQELLNQPETAARVAAIHHRALGPHGVCHLVLGFLGALSGPFPGWLCGDPRPALRVCHHDGHPGPLPLQLLHQVSDGQGPENADKVGHIVQQERLHGLVRI